MINLNQDLEKFYSEYIRQELYRNKFYIHNTSYTPKVTFLNNVNRSNYWFPANTGSGLDKEKLKALGYKPLYSTFSISNLVFLDVIKLYIKSYYGKDVDFYIDSPNFKLVLTLLNESIRKQELRKILPKIKREYFNTWSRPLVTNRNIYLRYFFDFSAHRVISKIRKFNFLSFNNWWLRRKWLFVVPKMKTRYVRRLKPQHFQWKFHWFPGMSYKYWVQHQLQYNYFNTNSFNLLADLYSSKAFSLEYPRIATSYLEEFLRSPKNSFLSMAIFYWFLKNSRLENNFSQNNYFSFSYPTHHYTYNAKYTYLKNYYAYLTPRYSRAYFKQFRRRNFTNVYKHLRWYTFLSQPVYWNLKLGLDLHPHEFWSWEDVSWWEDNVTFKFFRFNKIKRRARFRSNFVENLLGYYNIDAIWLYKSWIHENIFLEFLSSYYKSYLNFKYLSPDSRFYSEYPNKRKGHFDPYWQDRLYEYTFHRHPDYFFPSTQRFYEQYSGGIALDKLESFLALNFSWKFNKNLFILRQKGRFLSKNVRSTVDLEDVSKNFKPNFKEFNVAFNNLDFVMPVLFINNLYLLEELKLFSDNLIFLINFFYSINEILELSLDKKEFLFTYLSHLNIIYVNKNSFLSKLEFFDGKTFFDLNSFVLKEFNLCTLDLSFPKERIIAEYTAFKRWYILLTSEYINNK